MAKVNTENFENTGVHLFGPPFHISYEEFLNNNSPTIIIF